MPKQITQIDEFNGKTVARAYGQFGDTLWFVFEDGDYAKIIFDSVDDNTWSKFDNEFTMSDKLYTGMITKEEHNDYISRQIKKNDDDNKERRRQEYERLKQEFESQ